MYKAHTYIIGVLIPIYVLIGLLVPFVIYGQEGDISIVSTYTIVDEEIASGDIISFDSIQNVFYRSKVTADSNMFGVIVENPVVVFRSDGGTIPVAQSGAVLVNATTINGSISIGEFITSSRVPGKAERYGGKGDVLGVALEPLNSSVSSSTIQVGESKIIEGVLLVELNIGPPSGIGSIVSENPPSIVIQENNEIVGPGLVAIFRYLAAVIFAIGSLYLAFKYFGQNFTQGVVSIGRNPLAKSTIQAMVTLNVILILIVAVGSFFVSIVILFLPL